MNIIYDHTIFCLQQYGGISRYFHELINRVSIDNDVNIFKGLNINEYEFNKENLKSFKGYKIPQIKYTGTLLTLLNNVGFDKEYSKIDDGMYHPTYYRKDMGKFTKMPIVLTVYDMIYEMFPDNFWNADSVIKSKKASIDCADAIICISENTKRDLMKLYDISGNKIIVVYLSCTLPETTEIYKSDKPYLLYVGDRSAPYKNFWHFINVYAKYLSNEYSVVVFGGGFSPKELKFISEHRLENSVFHMQGDDTVLRSIYNGAYCLVYPSLYEGFGIPPLEAMISGCPVVASDSSSIPEVVGDAGILFNPLSEDSMLDAILAVDKNRFGLVTAGYERVNRFSWDKMAKETMDVYESVSK